MDAAAGSLIAVLTIARVAGLFVLATEALFLWTRRRDLAAPAAEPQQGPALGRFFWAATPALILAGLALWCLASVAPQRTQWSALPLQQQSAQAD
jgi:heme/copper-type cytochrome/quinol oxidase subunit 2